MRAGILATLLAAACTKVGADDQPTDSSDDADQVTIDAGGGGASFTDCESSVRTLTNGNSTTEATTYFKVVPFTSGDFWMCDLECFDETTCAQLLSNCPVGWDCDDAHPVVECVQSSASLDGDGNLILFCGYRQRQLVDGAAVSDTGYRARELRVQ